MSLASRSKLDSLRSAGRFASILRDELAALLEPGVNVLDLEAHAAAFVKKNGIRAAFLGYKNYPAVLCVSLNDQIVHGLPCDYQIKAGDLVSIDLGIAVNDWIVDTARTHLVPPSKDSAAERLLAVTRDALAKAIGYCQPGYTVGDIGSIVQQTVEQAGFSIVRELHGHGVGRTLQEPPTIPNYGQPGRGAILKKGMVLAIEPITCLRPTEIKVLADGWTIAAKNKALAAHFEDTVVVDSPPIVLTVGDKMEYNC